MKMKFDFDFSNKDQAAKKNNTKLSSKNFRKQPGAARLKEEVSAPVTTIYIGNLNYKRDEEGIKSLFAPYGYVKSVKIVMKKDSQLKAGFAFVQMTNDEKANIAVTKLNGTIVDERTLKVSIANDRFAKA